MTWTYSGDPSLSSKDKVRFLVGDTNSDDQLITDEEITWALTEGGVYPASATIARAIAAFFSRKASFEISKDLKVSFKDQADNYNKMADKFDVKAGKLSPIPFAGGISVANKETYEEDTDRVKPSFGKTNFMDNEDSATSLTLDSGT